MGQMTRAYAHKLYMEIKCWYLISQIDFVPLWWISCTVFLNQITTTCEIVCLLASADKEVNLRNVHPDWLKFHIASSFLGVEEPANFFKAVSLSLFSGAALKNISNYECQLF